MITFVPGVLAEAEFYNLKKLSQKIDDKIKEKPKVINQIIYFLLPDRVKYLTVGVAFSKDYIDENPGLIVLFPP